MAISPYDPTRAGQLELGVALGAMVASDVRGALDADADLAVIGVTRALRLLGYASAGEASTTARGPA